MEQRVLCPRCGGNMTYFIEVEGGNSKRVHYYYKCVVCGYKLDDLVLVVRRKDRRIEIEALEPQRQLVYPINVVRK
ncbi:hypothetical protein Pyrfu_1540 [Pyrolobus fumarii 1A]|uniref:Uncharacterized protein n=1 Tax=Pyrolobus fumarii (strain DSM 11204 / 1A) TaxID=694429 RepID=G0EHP4_PYRF1|nr:hypothetical protein [Pyrolobus fumarii]AEM39397.1 hypothetical protein Pyrfu_1540 [Pyrolobus fumarii 1A]